jgi:pyruvate formate lyase activating enzyme
MFCQYPILGQESPVTGTVFDIREFALFDGPGLRTTVFLKGCPLRCAWCHNPEGLTPEPQVLRSAGGERLVGQRFTAAALATRLNRQADLLRDAGGGVTFSGGEPLSQADFVSAVIAGLDRQHVVLDTSGYGDELAFRRLLDRVDLVFFDLKLIDAHLHERYTGSANGPILRNLQALSESKRPYVIRVPLIPGVTDTPENLGAIAATCRCLPGLLRVDLLPYHRAAGGKYGACGLRFSPAWDESRPVRADTGVFERAGLAVRVV